MIPKETNKRPQTAFLGFPAGAPFPMIPSDQKRVIFDLGGDLLGKNHSAVSEDNNVVQGSPPPENKTRNKPPCPPI